MRKRGLRSLALVAALAISPTSARASGVLLSDGTEGREHAFRLLVERSHQTTTVIEEVEIVASGRFALFKAFPAQLKEMRKLEPGLFEALADRTRVDRTNRDRIQEVMFGPSIVTLLTRREDRVDAETPAPSSDVLQNRRLAIEPSAVRFFQGPMIETSTVTGAKGLPGDFDDWLRRNSLSPTPQQRRVLADSFDAGWVVMTVLVNDAPTSPTGRLTVGPTLYRFDASEGFVPSAFDAKPVAADKTFEFYLLGPRPMVPDRFDVVWEARPWMKQRRSPEIFYATYSRPLGVGLGLELENRAGFKLPSDHYLVRGELRYLDPPRMSIPLRRLSMDDGVRQIPGAGETGSLIDLLLCMLLGLTPLLYTPESWFLLWLASRARARQEISQEITNPIGLYLWPLFSLGVAAYWAFTLPGGARAACLAPLLLGIFRLAVTSPGRGPKRLRVDFTQAKNAK